MNQNLFLSTGVARLLPAVVPVTVKQAARRTNLEIADRGKRFYAGPVLARRIHQVGSNTLARMKANLTPTATTSREGTGKVKHTDYLADEVMVESSRSVIARLTGTRMPARRFKTRHDPLARQPRPNLRVGTKVLKQRERQ